ncbi:hypothetical protein [Bacillus sp. REN3]|uniref:hypothetical protein n=1 Tax=Bacillus sp. REN3 TaxID=2802440 RepID=UPI001FEF1893|nr:hypothetical protein [Bacillus sp. REN3]
MIDSWAIAFLIPIVAIVATHFQKMARIKRDMLEDQLELERLKHENFLLETEKMRLELNKMQLESPDEKQKVL